MPNHSLGRILNKIWQDFGCNQKAVEVANLHLIGGGYNWRQMRGISRLSMHALGCAVDIDPDHNSLGDPTPVIGRREDLHVIYVWEQIGDVLWERERIEQKRATFAAMDEAFDDVMTRYRVGRACIDQTGMGEKVVEDAQARYGSRVEGVLFTGPNKLIMATRGKERFEDRTVRIKMGDQKLRADLHKLRKVASATGAPRFVAERDEDHADRTWAAFLGIHAADGPGREYDYQAAPPNKSRYTDIHGTHGRKANEGAHDGSHPGRMAPVL
ncbi:hypothetical protein [Rhizobium sp. AB2/73]|uniref:phage terminase large subunit family protein n=1 Tax=Rhizobium sp. AB2/73 TaxID=2795216 RepID=UPI001E653AF0|nr:hypothetical protein [Rhizobium sp. AB2/73]